MIEQQTITRNSIIALGGSIVQKLLTLGYFIVVARAYGPLDQGRYSTALAFTTLFGVLIDFGLSSALTREIARNPEKTSDYTNQMMILRIALGVCVYTLMIGVAVFLGYPDELISLIFIAGIAACIDVITTSCWSILRGFQNLWYEAVGGVIAIGTMLAVGIPAIILQFPVHALVIAVVCGSIANFITVLFILLFKVKISISFLPKIRTIIKLFSIALPFAGAAFFSRVITFFDTSLITMLVGAQFAGWYAAGNKLVLALNILPASVSASIYSAMSAAFQESRHERIGDITAKALVYLFLISMPIAVGTVMTAPHLVSIFYGHNYVPTVTVLQFLMPALVFGFLSYPIGSLLAATNRQKVNTLLFGIAAGVSIDANLFLIPLMDAQGSALASSLTSAVLFFGGLIAVRQWLRPHVGFLSRACVKILAACMMMAAALFLMRDFSIFTAIPSAMIAYGAGIFLLRVFPMPELDRILRSLLRA